ncbi:F0F1 ATP synthase subunit epsilon [Streptococcus pneumoniae 5787-06]|nr:F0F1 ATP synthase subunit epsilon [Streptococcus pneumoniae 5787-06]
MMVNKKQVKVGISTIYYWFHNGHLGLTKADMLYPRKRKVSRSKLVRTLSRQVNLSKNVLTLLIFAWKMVIMKLIPSY